MHVGYGVTKDTIYVIHPDTEKARIAYGQGQKDAFAQMMANRKMLNDLGIPYHNTRWDLMFTRLIAKRNVSYLKYHPYPNHSKYGRCGR